MGAPVKILVADDEEDILDLLSYNFQAEGYEVLKARNGREVIAMLENTMPDLIVLDIMMPEKDGVTACRDIRMIPGYEDVPIVFLTARSEEYSEVAGFEAGADDYICKPIKPRVLKSRIRALLKRRSKAQHRPAGLIQIHGLDILRDEYVVRKDGQAISLPRKEFELFHFLASRPGKVFSREDLLLRIWENIHVTDRTVDVHVRKLREKIGMKYIVTVKGVGYKFLSE